MIRVAVIGAGYMGRAHARVVRRISEENPDLAEIAYIVDIDYSRAKLAAKRYGGKPLDRINGIAQGEADLAIIATPTKTHKEVFMKLASRGIQAFLVEKPLASSLKETLEILEKTRENNLWVAVGHIERFNPAVTKFLEKTKKGMLGEILTTVSRRVGPYTPRVSDTSVVHDLAVHEIDISILVYQSLPNSIKSYTLENLVSNLADYALLVLNYTKGFSSIEVNRVTPFKQRAMYITGTKGVAYIDYLRQELNIHVQDLETRVLVQREEPLYLEDLSILESLKEKREPPVDIHQAFIAMFLCEKALDSTRENREIEIEEEPEYQSYRDVFQKGLKGFQAYYQSIK